MIASQQLMLTMLKRQTSKKPIKTSEFPAADFRFRTDLLLFLCGCSWKIWQVFSEKCRVFAEKIHFWMEITKLVFELKEKNRADPRFYEIHRLKFRGISGHIICSILPRLLWEMVFFLFFLSSGRWYTEEEKRRRALSVLLLSSIRTVKRAVFFETGQFNFRKKNRTFSCLFFHRTAAAQANLCRLKEKKLDSEKPVQPAGFAQGKSIWTFGRCMLSFSVYDGRVKKFTDDLLHPA